MFERPPGFQVDLSKSIKFIDVHDDAMENNRKDVWIQKQFRSRYLATQDVDYMKKLLQLTDGDLVFATFERIRREIQDIQFTTMLSLGKMRRPPITPVIAYRNCEANFHREGSISFTTRKRSRYVDVTVSLKNNPPSVLGKRVSTGQYIALSVDAKLDSSFSDVFSRSLLSGELIIDVIINKLWPELDKDRRPLLPIEKPKVERAQRPKEKKEKKAAPPPTSNGAPKPPVEQLEEPKEAAPLENAEKQPEEPKEAPNVQEESPKEDIKRAEQPEDPAPPSKTEPEVKPAEQEQVPPLIPQDQEESNEQPEDPKPEEPAPTSDQNVPPPQQAGSVLTENVTLLSLKEQKHSGEFLNKRGGAFGSGSLGGAKFARTSTSSEKSTRGGRGGGHFNSWNSNDNYSRGRGATHGGGFNHQSFPIATWTGNDARRGHGNAPFLSGGFGVNDPQGPPQVTGPPPLMGFGTSSIPSNYGNNHQNQQQRGHAHNPGGYAGGRGGNGGNPTRNAGSAPRGARGASQGSDAKDWRHK